MPPDDALPGNEQSFFPDPAIDRLLGVIFKLAAELHVTRDRLQTLELALTQAGQLKPDAIEKAAQSAVSIELAAERRRAYVRDILSPLLGRAESRHE